MIRTKFFAVLCSTLVVGSLASAAATDWPFPTAPNPAPGPQPIFQHGECSIVTKDLVTIPGLAANVKATTLRAKTAVLRSQLDNVARKLNLLVELNGVDVNQKPLTYNVTAALGQYIGTDFRVFTYEAPNPTDEIAMVQFTLEIYQRGPKSQKGLLSILVRSNAVDPTTGKGFLRTTSTRFFCNNLMNL